MKHTCDFIIKLYNWVIISLFIIVIAYSNKQMQVYSCKLVNDSAIIIVQERLYISLGCYRPIHLYLSHPLRNMSLKQRFNNKLRRALPRVKE